MAKYDVNGDGVFSAEEVRNIVRDLEDTEAKVHSFREMFAQLLREAKVHSLRSGS